MRTMDAPEDVLFDNLLDALDRLADHECGAVDVQALAQATAKAVTPHPITPLLEETAAALGDLRRRGLPPEQIGYEALVVTDALRLWLAEDWGRRWKDDGPAGAGPSQRPT